jgi:hypothetical protein
MSFTREQLCDAVCKDGYEEHREIVEAASRCAMDYLRANGCIFDGARPEESATRMRRDCLAYIKSNIDRSLTSETCHRYGVERANPQFVFLPIIFAGILSAVVSYFVTWLLDEWFGPKGNAPK